MSTKSQRVVDKYLARYAEAEAGFAAHIEGRFDTVLVLPVRDEALARLDTLGLECSTDRRLVVIVVVNATPSSDAGSGDRDRAWLSTLGLDTETARARGWSQVPHPRLGERVTLIGIDRCRGDRAFGERDGVGLARKLGLDLALALWRRELLRSPWLHTTDADATLPAGHFDPPADADAVARVARYWHDTTGDGPVARATALYELWLRQYVAGLGLAGSRFAFDAIGSCISVHAAAYAQVRGVPRRQAGEDFHLLDKLAKVGPLVRTPAAAPPVRLAPRMSTRVPFGTGPGVARIDAALRRGEPVHLYDPAVFAVLRRVLAGLARHADAQDDGVLLADTPPLVRQVIERQLLPGLRRASRSSTDPHRRRRAYLEWFDGLRTLQFIHALEASAHPRRPWQKALRHSELFGTSPYPCEEPHIDDLRRHLESLAPDRTGL